MAQKSEKTAYQDVLIRPRVTEKSALLSERGAYTFEISDRANKKEVMKAIKEVYALTPVKVHIAKGVTKNVRRKGRAGTRTGHKRAIVTLKKGDKIQFI